MKIADKARIPKKIRKQKGPRLSCKQKYRQCKKNKKLISISLPFSASLCLRSSNSKVCSMHNPGQEFPLAMSDLSPFAAPWEGWGISEQVWCLDSSLSFVCHCNLLLLFCPLSAFGNRLAWKEESCESHLQQLLEKSSQVRTVPSSWCSQQSERLMVCMTGWRFQPSQIWWLQLKKKGQTHTRFVCFLASAEAPFNGSGRGDRQAE